MDKRENIAILYVDDEKSNLFLFKVTFESEYKVLTAESPEVGLDVLDEHQDEIIVVISDMRMPKMNGIEFIKKAKSKHKNIAYFILTGFDFNNDIDEALKENLIQKFFTKPFDVKEIKKSIEKAIDSIPR